MTKDSFVVKTQLVPPRPKKNLLKRKRLLKLLQDSSDKKLILITAGAGYGKTTLLSQFVNELKSPFVFFTPSRSDASLNAFLGYLVAGVSAIHKGLGARTQSMLGAMNSANPNLEMLIGTFVNELLDTTKKELLIVIEDYHLLDKTELIGKALDYLLEHLPNNVHLIISSRTAPPLAIAKLRAKGELLELDNDDLKFTTQEVKALFRDIYNIDVPASQMKEIQHCFAGWATALQLMSYLFRKDPDKALDRIEEGKESIDYFQAEVFQQQPEELRSFLLGSSILDQMTPDSCDVILGKNNSRGILEKLMEKNLFTSCIDEREEVFRYHQLFRNFLLKRLSQEQSKKAIAKRHLLAGAYFDDAGDYGNSVKHYLSARSTKNALRIIEVEGESLLELERFDTLNEWLERLPSYLLGTNAVLLRYQGVILSRRGQSDEAMEMLKKARMKYVEQGKRSESAKATHGIACILFSREAYEEAIESEEEALRTISHEENSYKARILNNIGIAYFSLGNHRKAISVLSQGVTLSRRIGSYRLERAIIGNLLLSYGALGYHAKAIEEAKRIVEKEDENTAHLVRWIQMNLGHEYTLRGQFKRARDALLRALQLNRAVNDRIGMGYTFYFVAALYRMMRNFDLSQLYQKRAVRIGVSMGDDGLKHAALLGISKTYLLENNPLKARQYIDRIPPGSSDPTVKGEIELQLGRLEEAEELFALDLKRVRKSQLKYGLTGVHACLTRLYHVKGEEKLLRRHLEQALKLSRKYGYDVPLTTVMRIGLPMLQFAVRNEIEPEYATSLLDKLNLQHDMIIDFFGGLRIKGNDGKIADMKWKTQNAKLLFCYLLVNRNREFATDQLMEILWPGKRFSRAQSSFWNAISSVRTAVSTFTKKETPLITHKSGCYGINKDYKIRLDCEEFDTLIKQAHVEKTKDHERISIAQYESAIDLYAGDFLAEMYEPWSDEQRLFYKSQYVQILDRVVTFYMKEKKFQTAIEYSGKAIAADRLHEPAYLTAMRSHIELGHRKAALDLYAQLRETLNSELNAEPSPEARKLFREAST